MLLQLYVVKIVIYDEGRYFRIVGAASAFGLGAYSLAIAYLRDLRLARIQSKNTDTINWFTTLINLMSHNLRTPLANIKWNLKILTLLKT